MKRLVLCLAGLAIWIGGIGSSTEAAPITIANVTASSTFGSYTLNNLINGAGLSGGVHSNSFRDMWLSSNNDINAMLTFDLGSLFTVDLTTVWQYSPSNLNPNRGVKNMTVLSSTDGSTFMPLTTITELLQGTGDPILGQMFSLSGVQASHIKFNITANWGGSYSGLSEVQFSGTPGATAVTPEPSTLLFFVVGILGILGLGYRHRKKAA